MHGKGLALVFILLAFSLINMQFGFFLHSSGDVGIQPDLKISSPEKLTPATWIENRGTRYGVWDVRKENDNALMFMVVCSPENGTLIEDKEVTARVLAVRLTLEMARLVQFVAKQAKNTEKLVSIIGNVIDSSVSVTELSEQWKVARELRNLGSSFSQKAEVAFTLANVVASSKRPAENLIQERSDQEAEHFLTSIALTGIARGRIGTLMTSLVVKAVELMGIPTAEWINALYDKITFGQMPLLEALAQTFGRHETDRMFLQPVARALEIDA